MSDAAKRIVITGASKGLGLALGNALLGLGHQIEGCSRSGLKDGAFPVAAVDVCDRGAVTAWAARLIKSGHVPDILFTNAALINEPAPLWEVPGDEVEAIILTNILGTTNVLQAFLPAMIARGSGVVITGSSGWGRASDPEFAPYCASKFAIEGLSLSLAAGMPAGLAVVSLSPGIVRTDMLVRCWGEERALEYELPDAWAERAARFVLNLSPSDNGAQFTVPAPDAG